MTSSHHFYDITRTIFDIVSPVSVSSHPIYWWYHRNWIFELSSAIYDDIVYIVYDITATECVSSHPPFQWYNNLCMWDITPTLCIISYTLYKDTRPHFMTSHHIFMTSQTLYSWHHPTISEMASTISVSSQWLYWWSHTYCMYDITPTLCMPAYALYTTSHPHFMTSSHCSYHITFTAFMTSDTLFMRSHTWQYKHYICHLTRYI